MASPTPKHVLFVDDDPHIRDIFARVLAYQGFSVETAENGARALELLRTGQRPDVIFVDLLMPVMNGVDFLIRKASDLRIRDIPVALLSANTDPRASELATVVLEKPVPLDRRPGGGGSPRAPDRGQSAGLMSSLPDSSYRSNSYR